MEIELAVQKRVFAAEVTELEGLQIDVPEMDTVFKGDQKSGVLAHEWAPDEFYDLGMVEPFKLGDAFLLDLVEEVESDVL